MLEGDIDLCESPPRGSDFPFLGGGGGSDGGDLGARGESEDERRPSLASGRSHGADGPEVRLVLERFSAETRQPA